MLAAPQTRAASIVYRISAGIQIRKICSIFMDSLSIQYRKVVEEILKRDRIALGEGKGTSSRKVGL